LRQITDMDVFGQRGAQSLTQIRRGRIANTQHCRAVPAQGRTKSENCGGKFGETNNTFSFTLRSLWANYSALCLSNQAARAPAGSSMMATRPISAMLVGGTSVAAPMRTAAATALSQSDTAK